ncbi:MAG: LCP family protein [Pseudobutyrivibrio sp.]|nr:LCP family protein [Pseudobutyrivibrio sp.]
MSTYGRDDRRGSGRRPSGGQSRTGSRASSNSRGSRYHDSELSFDLTEEDLVGYDDYSTERTARTAGTRSSSARRPSGSRSSAGHSASRRPSGSHSSSHNSQQRPSQRRTSGSRSSAARTGSRRNKKKKARKTILIVEIVVLVVILLVVALWMKFGKANWDNINMDDIEVNNLDSETEELLSNYTTLALFGVDNRSNGNYSSGNSDTMMLVSINNDTKEVKMISVARDTYLEVSDDTYRKCNYAYNHGGAEQAISMLNKNLDLKISGYVAVDFYALATVVDDLGGLEINVTQSMIDAKNKETGGPALAGYIAEVEEVLYGEGSWEERNDCFLEAGTQTLNGAQVVGYCRNRYVGNNDFGRAERQRAVVQQIVEKAKKSDISTINKIVDDVLPSISTSLSPTQVASMATSVGDYEIVESSGFPFTLTTGTYGSKGSLVVPCTLTSNVIKLHEFLYDQQDYDATDDKVDVISEKIQKDTGTDESSATETQTSDE